MSGNAFSESSGETFKPINAAGGVLLRYIAGEPHVLLILRKHSWDLPKGKQEKDENVRECALREVAEEVGIEEKGLTLQRSLGTTLHRYTEKRGAFEKTTYWFLMRSTSSSFTPQQKEGITKTCWQPLPQALEMVAFENLRTLLHRLQDYLKYDGAQGALFDSKCPA